MTIDRKFDTDCPCQLLLVDLFDCWSGCRATIVRRARDAIGLYDAIALGSGDREHPQSETNKKNWFFLFKDRNVISGDPAVTRR